MNFFSPGFLFWLFALPIPFIIHLWYRHRLKKMYFSSIMLLKRAKKGESSFKKLKDILLLIIRTLSILFCVLAFADPYILRKEKIAILDDSYDMLTKKGSDNLFSIAVKKATALKQKGIKIILASGETDWQCKYQKFYIPTNNIDYIITKKGKIPQSSGIKIIELEGEENTFSIDSIKFLENIFVFVTNHSNEDRTTIVSLVTENDTLQTSIFIKSNSNGTAIFPNIIGSGYAKIEETDGLLIDNIIYFVNYPQNVLKVLLVGDSVSLFFLKNALSPSGYKSNIDVEISSKLSYYKKYDAIAIEYLPTHITDKMLIFPKSAKTFTDFLTISEIDETHPIFYNFNFLSEIRAIKFYNRWDLPIDEYRAIAKFSDGFPAIIEKNNSIILTFPLTIQSKDLILSPIFVPLIHRIVYYVSGKPIIKYNYTVGDLVKFIVPEYRRYECKTPNGITFLNPKLSANIYVDYIPKEPGLYKIEDLYKFAANINNSIIYSDIKIEPEEKKVSIKRWFFIFVVLLLISELIIRKL